MSSLISLVEAMYPQRGEEWVSTHANWPLCLMLRIGRRETEPAVAIENNSADDLQLIVPNLHRRYSGVTPPTAWSRRNLRKCSARRGSVPMCPMASRGWQPRTLRNYGAVATP